MFILYPMVEVCAVRRVWLDVAFAVAIGQGAAFEFPEIAGKFLHYSFIALTSTGYCDITPVHPYAWSMTTLEALSEGLFMAVLVARLVALEVDGRHGQMEVSRDKN